MIEFKVYATLADFPSGRPALVKRLEHEGVLVPYDHIIEVMRCLYGSQCVIVFTCML